MITAGGKFDSVRLLEGGRYSPPMLRRIRWFAYGMAAGVGGFAYVLLRLRRMRAALTPSNLARATALSLADALEAAGRRMSQERAPTPH
ncbi:MAG: hypothetical protein M3N51_03640 [Actinomycetota bacterium]|nr:hypothetical protein [Actinomycetota bacterium]